MPVARAIDGATGNWCRTTAKPSKRSSLLRSNDSHRRRLMRSKRSIGAENRLSASLTRLMNQRKHILCGGYHLLTGTTPWLQTGRKAGTCRQFFGVCECTANPLNPQPPCQGGQETAPLPSPLIMGGFRGTFRYGKYRRLHRHHRDRRNLVRRRGRSSVLLRRHGRRGLDGTTS